MAVIQESENKAWALQVKASYAAWITSKLVHSWMKHQFLWETLEEVRDPAIKIPHNNDICRKRIKSDSRVTDAVQCPNCILVLIARRLIPLLHPLCNLFSSLIDTYMGDQ